MGKIDYSILDHKMYFELKSNHYGKGPYHFKNSALSCNAGLAISNRYPRGYKEIIVDLTQTHNTGMLWAAHFIPWKRLWMPGTDNSEIGICSRCFKKLEDYVWAELNVSEEKLMKLLEENEKLLHEAITSWPN
jgi:hypothetical protein